MIKNIIIGVLLVATLGLAGAVILGMNVFLSLFLGAGEALGYIDPTCDKYHRTIYNGQECRETWHKDREKELREENEKREAWLQTTEKAIEDLKTGNLPKIEINWSGTQWGKAHD